MRDRGGFARAWRLVALAGFLCAAATRASDQLIPGLDYSPIHGDAERARATRLLQDLPCGCGCGMTLAVCLVKDTTCPRSPGLAALVVRLVAEGKSDDAVRERLKHEARGSRGPRLHGRLAAEVKAIPIEGAPFLGAADGRIVIVEFADFECPWCARTSRLAAQLAAAYPRDVKFVYKQFPLMKIHPPAHLAAEASFAAEAQGKFWEYHDKLYAAKRAGSALDRPRLEALALEAGLDSSRFKQALDSGEFKGRVDRDRAEGQAAGVHGTPSFFIAGRAYEGARDFAAFKAVIDELLATPTATP